MRAKRRAEFVFLAITLVVGARSNAIAQGTMHRPTAPSASTDSEGHSRIDTAKAPGEKAFSGAVVFADGSVLEQLVSIYAGCSGAQSLVATADSKGHFSFDSATLAATKQEKGCEVRAFLEGYRSETRAFTNLSSKSDLKLGTFTLQRTADRSGLTTTSDEQGGKAQSKYKKALDEAARRNWPGAVDSLQKLTSSYPNYSSAWLTLGILQMKTGDRTGAEKSLLESIRSDPKFALPLVQAATLEAAQGNWPATLDHSQKAISLNATAFPEAYAWSAIANISMQHIDAAEKSAREGLELDTEHQYPELEYALGIVLYSKNDVEGARKYLQSYVSRAPNGPNAAAARSELVRMRSASVAENQESFSSPDSQSPEELPGSPTEAGPTTDSLRHRNAALLLNTPAHTCLESVSRAQIDTRGRLHDPELTRVEIAVSNNREVYGDAEGKRISNERAADLLGYSFSSSGLFASLARALIAGNNATVEFAGKDTLHGEPVFRYNFRVLPGQVGWSIQYGKESGQAGEAGWFLVDSTDLTLRRVVVHTIGMPGTLKLKELNAVIDYEQETIADRRILLPYVAEVHAEERTGTQRISRMFFDHCRAFTAETTLSFDVDASPTQSHQSSRKSELPPDLKVVVSLLTPVSMSTASVSDVVAAIAVEPVFYRGHEIVARGAALEGHVRPRRGENAVLVELDRVETRNGWAPFYARIISLAPMAEAKVDGTGPQKNESYLLRQSGGSGAMADPEIPGVVQIDFTSKSAELPAGTRSVWKTEPLVTQIEARPPQLNTPVDMH